MSSSYVPVESLLQSSAFRRLFVVSLLGHILVYAFLVFRGSSHATLIAAAPVMVQIVDMPKAPPAPPAAKPPAPPPPEEKPKPPEPPPPPPPPKPLVKEIVIPKEPAPLPAKPKPKPPPSAEELIAKMTQRVEEQEATKPPPAPPAATPGEAPAGPQPGLASPGVFDPLMSPYLARVKLFVRGNWAGASVCEGKPMAVFNVDVDAAGHLHGIELSQSSGDPHCDDTGERALRKSDPLPTPPHAVQFELAMDPKVTP